MIYKKKIMIIFLRIINKTHTNLLSFEFFLIIFFGLYRFFCICVDHWVLILQLSPQKLNFAFTVFKLFTFSSFFNVQCSKTNQQYIHIHYIHYIQFNSHSAALDAALKIVQEICICLKCSTHSFSLQRQPFNEYLKIECKI